MRISIVGAGVIGCAIAHELTTRGATVRVFDPRGIGLGATRASAGVLAPHVEGHFDALRQLSIASLAMYDAFVRRVQTDSGQTVEYERCGSLHVAFDAMDLEALEAMRESLAGAGVPHDWLDKRAAMRLEPHLAPALAAALHIREHGYVRARALTHALAAAATRAGASFTTSSVLAIEGGPVPRVVTSDGEVESDAVVVAAGAWAGTLAQAGAQPPVKPIRGQLLQLRVDTPPASRVVWGSRCYLVPWRDGTVLAGATVEDVGFDERATAAGVRDLLESSGAMMPVLGTAAFEEVRTGLRPHMPDELPAIGPSSTMPHVFYAAGHYRTGVLLTPLTARLVADLVLEGREAPELALVHPARLGL